MLVTSSSQDQKKTALIFEQVSNSTPSIGITTCKDWIFKDFISSIILLASIMTITIKLDPAPKISTTYYWKTEATFLNISQIFRVK